MQTSLELFIHELIDKKVKPEQMGVEEKDESEEMEYREVEVSDSRDEIARRKSATRSKPRRGRAA